MAFVAYIVRHLYGFQVCRLLGLSQYQNTVSGTCEEKWFYSNFNFKKRKWICNSNYLEKNPLHFSL